MAWPRMAEARSEAPCQGSFGTSWPARRPERPRKARGAAPARQERDSFLVKNYPYLNDKARGVFREMSPTDQPLWKHYKDVLLERGGSRIACRRTALVEWHFCTSIQDIQGRHVSGAA